MISSSLSLKTRDYIFQGIVELLPRLMISNLRFILYKKIDDQGVERLCKNVYAIQQTLTRFVVNCDVRYYNCNNNSDIRLYIIFIALSLVEL